MELSKLYADSDRPQRKKPAAPRSADGASSRRPRSKSIYAAATEVRSTPASPAPSPRDGQERSEERPARERKRRRRRERRKAGAAERAKNASQRREAARDAVLPADGVFGGAFRAFPLSAQVLKAVDDMGWEAPSEIQERMIPRVLAGRDVVGQARTGTGKTGAFAIPLVERLKDRAAEGAKGRAPSALVLSPTRELALQIHRQMIELAAYTKLRCVAVYGGAPMEPQLRALRAGCDVVVGTPGRVMDHMRRGTLRTDAISCFVLDEADRMFDLGFRDDIYWVSRRLPDEGRQTLLLSATMPKEVLRLSKEVTSDPEEIYTATGTLTVQTVEQFYISVDSPRKLGLLVHLVGEERPEKGIVFTRTKRAADRIAESLRKRGIDAGEIHGDLRQRRREQILERFREGNLAVMVATDVAARGLDIQGVTHVINFDIPEDPEDYVHRVGRTARMGRTGRAFTFVTPEEGRWLDEIEKLINKQVPRFEVEGYRCKATDEELARSPAARRGRPQRDAGEHPMARKLSPALLSLLNNRRGGGRRGPPPKSGGGRKKGRGRR
ncbi:MAG: DEAD/DEAH box helicase [Planctomycetota bacterium]|nr:MAG: DEAD/DEAH box helicase [Planctomycetota bacterium]